MEGPAHLAGQKQALCPAFFYDDAGRLSVASKIRVILQGIAGFPKQLKDPVLLFLIQLPKTFTVSAFGSLQSL